MVSSSGHGFCYLRFIHESQNKRIKTPLNVAMRNCCPSEVNISHSMWVHATHLSPGRLPSVCTISLKTKLCLYNCLMQGSPDLKSRLQDALGVSPLAETGRPTSLGTEGTGTRQGGSRAVGSAPGRARGHVLCPPFCRGEQPCLRTCWFSFLVWLAGHW